MATKHIRVRLSFTHESDHQIEETTGAVITGMTGNKNYPNPPVDLAEVQAALTAFTAALAAQPSGGVHATANKNKKRRELVALLRKLASYVQGNCNDEITTLLSSGFQAVSTARAQSPLPKPTIAVVDNGHSGQLRVDAKKVVNARTYDVEKATIGPDGVRGPWQAGGLFTKSRGMLLSGLTPGTTYAVHVRAVGGSTNYSDWSDPVSHMCM
jgi:hypothetical protein